MVQAAHTPCSSSVPAKAETLAHNMAGSDSSFTETGDAFFRKSLARDGAHVTQGGLLLVCIIDVCPTSNRNSVFILSGADPARYMFHNTGFKHM